MTPVAGSLDGGNFVMKSIVTSLHGVSEGSRNWRLPYFACRDALFFLLRPSLVDMDGLGSHQLTKSFASFRTNSPAHSCENGPHVRNAQTPASLLMVHFTAATSHCHRSTFTFSKHRPGQKMAPEVAGLIGATLAVRLHCPDKQGVFA